MMSVFRAVADVVHTRATIHIFHKGLGGGGGKSEHDGGGWGVIQKTKEFQERALHHAYSKSSISYSSFTPAITNTALRF
jgi:hypothetical protein